MKKACDLQGLALKEQYLAKIKCGKRCVRFLQLDDKSQLMICKIEGLRESGSNNHFIDEVLETFEEESMQLQKQKKTVEEMREHQGDYVNTTDEIVEQHQKAIEEKDEKSIV